jgi:hypothetical protein
VRSSNIQRAVRPADALSGCGPPKRLIYPNENGLITPKAVVGAVVRIRVLPEIHGRLRGFNSARFGDAESRRRAIVSIISQS